MCVCWLVILFSVSTVCGFVGWLLSVVCGFVGRLCWPVCPYVGLWLGDLVVICIEYGYVVWLLCSLCLWGEDLLVGYLVQNEHCNRFVDLLFCSLCV